MAKSPTLYCSNCRTTEPPLFARGSYSCVMCGKTRSRSDYRIELEKLRLTAPPVEEAPPDPPPATTCAWTDCENPPRANSKYCSRNCSNKSARWRHAQRTKE